MYRISIRSRVTFAYEHKANYELVYFMKKEKKGKLFIVFFFHEYYLCNSYTCTRNSLFSMLKNLHRYQTVYYFSQCQLKSRDTYSSFLSLFKSSSTARSTIGSFDTIVTNFSTWRIFFKSERGSRRVLVTKHCKNLVWTSWALR